MDKLPVVSGRDGCSEIGEDWTCACTAKGEPHDPAQRDATDNNCNVPGHGELKRGTLKNILRQIDLTIQEFEKLK